MSEQKSTSPVVNRLMKKTKSTLVEIIIKQDKKVNEQETRNSLLSKKINELNCKAISTEETIKSYEETINSQRNVINNLNADKDTLQKNYSATVVELNHLKKDYKWNQNCLMFISAVAVILMMMIILL